MKKSFKKGIKKYYEDHPDDSRMHGILTCAIMSIFEVTSYQQVKNYINGVTGATSHQYNQVQGLFLTYGITNPFD